MPDFAAPLFDWARNASNSVRQLLALPPAMSIDYPFADSDVAQLQRVTASPDSFALDDQTWDDLMLAPWLASVSGEVSIAGRQELYRRLRAGLDEAARAALGRRLRDLLDNPARIEAMRETMRPLRGADTDIASLLFEGEALTPPAWLRWTALLPLALVLSIAAVIWSPLAWIGSAVVLYTLIALQMRYHERVEAWKRALNTVQLLLLATSRLGAEAPDAVPDACGYAVRLSRSLSRSLVARISPASAPMATGLRWPTSSITTRRMRSSCVSALSCRPAGCIAQRSKPMPSWRGTCQHRRTGAGPGPGANS